MIRQYLVMGFRRGDGDGEIASTHRLSSLRKADIVRGADVAMLTSRMLTGIIHLVGEITTRTGRMLKMGSSWTCFEFHTPSVPGWVDREPQHRSWKRAKLNLSQIVKNGQVWLTMTAYIVIFCYR